MSHRVRSKTVDSGDPKRAKGTTPRRITEKIAIIKKREHQQSAQFEEAMQSILEMQQARIHSGGGSMPSLQAIDSTPPAPTIDMQSIFRDFDEMKRGSGTTMECPSRPPRVRTSSMDPEPYLGMGLGSGADQYWNVHKSDSDLQQSLMMSQPQTSPQHLGSPQQLHRQHKMNPPGDLSIWTSKKRPNSATSHALLSPDHFAAPPESLTPPPLNGSVGTASSLPDLTNMEFSSGLDIPLEQDDPIPDPQQFPNPFPQPYHLSPTNRTAGPSKLIYNSFQAPNISSPSYFQYPTPPTSGGYRQPYPLTQGTGISKSPTMPEFRNIHNGFVARYRPPPPAPPHYKPILPNNSLPLTAGLPGFLPQVGPLHTPAANHSGPPPMRIIIQPPPATPVSPSLPLRQQSLPTDFPAQNSPILRDQNIGGLPPSFDMPPPSPEKSMSNANQYLNGISTHKSMSVGSSVPTGFPGLCLPSYTEARLQQSLQQKFASINVGRNEAMIRSHSEENLQKIQKEKPEVIQHNPFMGTLANANSVPCVYVEPSGPENQNEQSNSPTLDSPSTSASYASSPPSVRPYWIEEESSLREYVFKEWPLDSGGVAVGGANRPASPLAHHRSLSDLTNIIPEITELVTSNRSHQLSLPSVAMTDLTVDEQLEKMNSPSDYYHDFEMGEAMMDSLLKNDVPDLHPFDIAMSDHTSSLVTDALLTASPDSFLRTEFN